MMGKVKILKPGFFTTIQDRGRFGFSKFGIPRSGAMDQASYTIANLLLGNHKNDACLEWGLQAPVLQFSEPTIICLAGAFTDSFLNDKPVEMYRQINIEKNDILNIDNCRNKMYGYVGIKGGLQSPVILNSRSFYKAITPQFVLSKNDEISYDKVDEFSNQFSSISAIKDIENTNQLMVYKGPEFDQLSNEQKYVLEHSWFTVSGKANRMAIQLEEQLPNNLSSMLTSPVLLGTIQLTPSGGLIVLMRDCQTTGGYPRVLQLCEKAIDSIAQKRRGEQFVFRCIDDV